VAVIGAGSAGLTAYRAAKAQGAQAVLIEGGAYGTTCARVGCMPSKLLIAAADAAHSIRHAGEFGIHAGPMRIDSRAVMARVKSERDHFVGFVLDQVEKMAPQDRMEGYARFINANELQIGNDTRITAKSIVIATGSRPWVPEELHGIGDRLLTSDQLFEKESLPQSIAVVGAGVIGLELGQALHRLGGKVTLFGRNQTLSQLTDPVVSESAFRCLERELDIRLNTRITKSEIKQEQVLLHYRAADGTERSEYYDCVLAATGRIPNVHALQLENAGLALNEQGIPLFDPFTMQCGDSAIFIAGDVNNQRPVLHEATDQGRIAGSNAALYPHVAQGLRHMPLSIAFTDPQIAMVGESWRALQGSRFVTGSVSFDNQGRSRVMLQNRGVLHVYADVRSGQFVGAEMVAPRAEHLAHLLAWACQSRMTIAQMLELPFYHPVVEEGVRTALRNAKEKLMTALPEIERCADCTPGT
jgi:dihydrolipoamide dehydrogenase